MAVTAVIAIIALIVAICACIMMANQNTSIDREAGSSDSPNVEEGRKICVVRGTAWVTSTQITVYHEPYDD